MCIAILSAMAEENASLVSHMQVVQKTQIGGRVYHQGRLWGEEVVVVFSHWGKVAAASTSTILINRFAVSEILFTGVAGAVDRSLNVGDIVIASNLYQHDMDVRPILQRFEIPLLGKIAMPSDIRRQAQLLNAASRLIDTQFSDVLSEASIDEFSLHAPKAIIGDVASGDQFVSSEAQAQAIKTELPEVVCVEMEGGALAQVCTEFGVPFSVIRTISDAADEHASVDFPKFVAEVAQQYSMGIIRNLFNAT